MNGTKINSPGGCHWCFIVFYWRWISYNIHKAVWHMGYCFYQQGAAKWKLFIKKINMNKYWKYSDLVQILSENQIWGIFDSKGSCGCRVFVRLCHQLFAYLQFWFIFVCNAYLCLYFPVYSAEQPFLEMCIIILRVTKKQIPQVCQNTC